MSDIPQISVVIPLFNKGRYIARAINSVLTQTYKNFEIIIVNDGSTDDGELIVRSFKDSRIELINQKNKGVSEARNKGVNDAKSEFIAFLDADDEWSSTHLETLLRLIKNFPNAGAYSTPLYVINGSNQARCPKYSTTIPNVPWEGELANYFTAAALGMSPVTASSVAIRKKILLELNGFPISEWWGEDSYVWGRIALNYPIAFSWDGEAYYHTDADNRACDRTHSVRENIFVVYAEEELKNGRVPKEKIDGLKEYLALKKIETAKRNIMALEPVLARNILMNCNTKLLRKEKCFTYIVSFVPKYIIKYIFY